MSSTPENTQPQRDGDDPTPSPDDAEVTQRTDGAVEGIGQRQQVRGGGAADHLAGGAQTGLLRNDQAAVTGGIDEM